MIGNCVRYLLWTPLQWVSLCLESLHWCHSIGYYYVKYHLLDIIKLVLLYWVSLNWHHYIDHITLRIIILILYHYIGLIILGISMLYYYAVYRYIPYHYIGIIMSDRQFWCQYRWQTPKCLILKFQNVIFFSHNIQDSFILKIFMINDIFV